LGSKIPAFCRLLLRAAIAMPPGQPDSNAKAAKAQVPDFSPASVLQATDKSANGALLIQERCAACHGRTVREALMPQPNKPRYRMADLKYDLKHGRLQILPAAAKAGRLPVSKYRPPAPLAGKPLPVADVDEFLRFLACQLRFECKFFTGEDVSLSDKYAEAMWPHVQAFITPNLGATERWIPYHTILGQHEFCLVQDVHSRTDWTDKQRFQAMFVFRAHCKQDLFRQAQLPLMKTKSFWQDPVKAFMPGGPMEKSLMGYRKTTNRPLLTNCFRIIPERVLKDDDQNLVRSITNRSMRLLRVSEECWPVLKSKIPPAEKLSKLSNLILQAEGCGETWAKMLTVCMDLAYPNERLLESQCEVGIGAAKPLQCLVGRGAAVDRREALSLLLRQINASNGPEAKHFWKTLQAVEKKLQTKFENHPLVVAQANTQKGRMSAVTLQVQLCEYRQYRHSIARLQYGLPDDESMRGDPEGEGRLTAADFIVVDDKHKVLTLEVPRPDSKKVSTQVSLRATGNNVNVARRLATMMFKKIRDGASIKEVETFRDEMLKDYNGGEDVPDDSEAWDVCRLLIGYPALCFHVEQKGGNRVAFQTTVKAVGGSALETERVARLCWQQLSKGVPKEKVLEYRSKLYAAIGSIPQIRKRSQEEAITTRPGKKQRI